MKTELINLNENMTISVAEDTQFVLDVVDGVEEKALTFELLFEKEGVSAEIISLNNIGAGHSINLTTITKHLVPNTACITTVKSVLNDNSKSTFIGKIIINSKASQTSSFLYDHVLVVGENTKNNSQPILQIDTDDVKASHGATTGRVDKDQLFYLTSRGLSLREAEQLLVEGFFESLLNKIIDDKVRAKIAERVKL